MTSLTERLAIRTRHGPNWYARSPPKPDRSSVNDVALTTWRTRRNRLQRSDNRAWLKVHFLQGGKPAQRFSYAGGVCDRAIRHRASWHAPGWYLSDQE
jgi:hypothetical protein